MRCHETRALETAYSDSELDTRSSLEIEQHLAICAGCSRYFEAQQKLDRRIDAALRPLAKDQRLWQRIETQLTPKPSTVSRIFWKRKIAVFAVAASLILSIAFLTWPRNPGDPLVSAVAADHSKYLAGNMPPQFADEPTEEALTLAAGRLDRAAFFLAPDSKQFTAQGKRLCHIEGTPIAWTMGTVRDTPVSVIAMNHTELAAFPGLRKRFEQGHRIACFKAGDFEFAARRIDDHIVCIIGDLPRPEMESLLASIAPSL